MRGGPAGDETEGLVPRAGKVIQKISKILAHQLAKAVPRLVLENLQAVQDKEVAFFVQHGGDTVGLGHGRGIIPHFPRVTCEKNQGLGEKFLHIAIIIESPPEDAIGLGQVRVGPEVFQPLAC
jgi:hypothetical protein